jgi:hypothetical protein
VEKEPLIKLTWHGHETVESIPALLDQAEQIEIILEFNALAGTLTTAQAAVRVASPPKVVITLPAANPKFR